MASRQFHNLLSLIGVGASQGRRDLAEVRRGFERLARLFPAPAEVTTETGRLGGRPSVWYEGRSADDGGGTTTVLYLHGGGYISGSPVTHGGLAARLARCAGARVAVLDYRLAPEHPFPAALDDALAAWRELLDQGAQRPLVAGDSAGAGLALALGLRAREEGDPLPAGLALLSPWVDLALTGDSMTSLAALDPLVSRQGTAEAAGLYLGDRDRRHPWASPLYGELAGLPPTLIQVGEREVLLDDARRLAERARAAGVAVELEVWPEMVHVWQLFGGRVPEADRAIERIARFLRAVDREAASGRERDEAAGADPPIG